jgi:hypothetical protein
LETVDAEIGDGLQAAQRVGGEFDTGEQAPADLVAAEHLAGVGEHAHVAIEGQRAL